MKIDAEQIALKLKERTYYQVLVSLSESNTMHRSIMATDFGYGNERRVTPATRIWLFNTSYEDEVERTILRDLYNITIERELYSK